MLACTFLLTTTCERREGKNIAAIPHSLGCRLSHFILASLQHLFASEGDFDGIVGNTDIDPLDC